MKKEEIREEEVKPEDVAEVKKTGGNSAAAIKMAAVLGVAAAGDFVAPETAEAQVNVNASVSINTPNANIHVSVGNPRMTHLTPLQQRRHIQHINRVYRNRPLSQRTLDLLVTFDPAIVGLHLDPFFIQTHIRIFMKHGRFDARVHIPRSRHRNFNNTFQRNYIIVNNTTVINNTTVVNNQQTPPRGSVAPAGTFERVQDAQNATSQRSVSSRQQQEHERNVRSAHDAQARNANTRDR